MSSPDRINLSLFSQVIPGGIKPATIFGVEFDPESQWLAVATNIAAKTLLENGHVGYLAMARPRDVILRDLSALGVNVSSAFEGRRLLVDDWYSATLTGGRVGTEGSHDFVEMIDGGIRYRTLKVGDLSVEWLKWAKLNPESELRRREQETGPPGTLFIAESCSIGLRFNEEKPYVEWMETRVNPNQRRAKRITLQGFVRGLHSEWLYRRMEADWDGVIDIRVMDEGGEAKSFLRIRSLKGQPYDGRWHEIEIRPNGEAVLRL